MKEENDRSNGSFFGRESILATVRRGTWGFRVLRYWAFFSCGISVILILTCGIAVSSSSAV